MGRNLRKFVNPRFIKTIDLGLLRRLIERQLPEQLGIELSVFDRDGAATRKALHDFFAGPELSQPPGLVADLHRIAELGNENGMRFLLERAFKAGISIDAPVDRSGQPVGLDPKHVALLMFLDHQDIFDAASDLLALETRTSLTEFAGAEAGVDPTLDDRTKDAFRRSASEIFIRDLQGDYCRVGWYEDDDEINLVVTYGATVSTVPVIDGGEENVISYQAAGHAVLAYAPLTGRLKIGGIARARRAELAHMFAAHILRKPDFFGGTDCQRLYTLRNVERAGVRFCVDHSFDPGILRVQIIEVQAECIATDPMTGDERVEWVFIVRDPRGNALTRLAENSRGLVFGPNRYRLGHMVLRVHIDAGRKTPARVTIKIKPPETAAFKRARFESRILELLRRNGFCHDRDATAFAFAAE